MLRALKLSIAQLGDPAILAVLAKSLGLTLAILALPIIGYWYLLDGLIGDLAGGIDPHGYAIVAVILAAITAWLLFRVVAIGVIGVFADDVVEAVERRHYPTMLAKARPIGIVRSARMGAASVVRALVVNVAVFPLSFVLLIPGLTLPILLLLANAWLLGRDLGDMVAVRHLAVAELPRWRRGTRARRFTLGSLMTGMFLVPIIGFFAPIIGAAMATHLFHDEATT